MYPGALLCLYWSQDCFLILGNNLANFCETVPLIEPVRCIFHLSCLFIVVPSQVLWEYSQDPNRSIITFCIENLLSQGACIYMRQHFELIHLLDCTKMYCRCVVEFWWKANCWSSIKTPLAASWDKLDTNLQSGSQYVHINRFYFCICTFTSWDWNPLYTHIDWYEVKKIMDFSLAFHLNS